MRLHWIFVGLGSLLSLAFLWLSSMSLPATLASHFNWAGQADGYMSRHAYLVLYSLLLLIMPWFIYLMAGSLPAYLARNADESLSIPHKAYWLAAERRDACARYFTNHACWLVLLILVLFDAIHLNVWRANQALAPEFAQVNFNWLLLFVVGAIVFWCGAMFAHFLRVPVQSAR